MDVMLVLIATILFQLIAALLALKLVRVTGYRTAWSLIAAAILLMIIRQSITLYELLSGAIAHPPGPAAEMVVLAASILILAGVALIPPFFLSTRQTAEEGQREALDTLHESEERFRSIAETSDAGYFFIDSYGLFRNVNKAWLRMHGYNSANEVIGRHYTLTQVNMDLKQAQGIVENLLGGEPIPAGEFSRLYKDGSIGYHTFSANTVVKDGAIIGLEGFIIDITKSKQAEESQRAALDDAMQATHTLMATHASLQESDKRYSSLFESMPSGVAVYEAVNEGEDFVFKNFNSAGERIDQINRKDVIEKRITEVFPGVKEFGLFEVLKRVWKTGESEYFSEDFYKDKRIQGWRENWVYMLPSGEIVAVYNDITKRKKAEKALLATHASLQESEEKYRAVAYFTYDWEYWIDPDGNYKYISPSCNRICGYRTDEFLADPNLLVSIIHPEDRDSFLKHQKEIEKKQDAGTLDLRITAKNGEEHWIGHVCQPLYDSNGLYAGQRASNRDITEQKMLLKQLEDKTGELESFVYTVSHDLTAPLVSIEGFSNYLMSDYNDKLDQEGQYYLGRIQKNIIFMGELIKDLLKISRIGKTINRVELVDVEEVINGIVEDFHTVIEQKSAEVIINTPLPRLWAESILIRQVFENLISNSLKFTGNRKKPVIEISADETGMGFFLFCIKDNGIGIGKEYHKKIFQLFERLNEIEAEGTGAGLTIVKNTIEHYGGKIRVESGKGKGSTFSFTLPKGRLKDGK